MASWEDEFLDYSEPLVKHMYALSQDQHGTEIGHDAFVLAREIELKLDKMQDLMADVDENYSEDEE